MRFPSTTKMMSLNSPLRSSLSDLEFGQQSGTAAPLVARWCAFEVVEKK